MGDHYAGQVVGSKADVLELCQECRDRALAPRLHQHGGVPLDQVAGGDPLPSPEPGVDFDDTVGHHDSCARG